MMNRRMPEIWGHRGFSARFPENSLRAFTEALDAGADGIEFDIQKTSDDRFAVIHDDSCTRTHQVQRDIQDMHSSEVHRLGIPLLDQVMPALEKYGYRSINIELKEETLEPGDFAAIHMILEEYLTKFNIIISSFRHDLLLRFSRAGYRCGLLVGEEHRGKTGELISSIIRIRPFSAHLPAKMHEDLPAVYAGMVVLLFKIFGVRLVYWTVNSRNQFIRLPRKLYAIISDDPILAGMFGKE